MTASRGRRPGSIGILLCDDQRLFTDALALALRATDDIELLEPPFSEGDAVVEAATRLKPDVVLMDVRLSKPPHGIEAARRIRSAAKGTKVVVLTADPREQRYLDALDAGASGLLAKDAPLVDVLAAVRAAARGESLVDLDALPALVERAGRSRDEEARAGSLTEREREIVDLVREGLRNDEIARRLFISPRTVETHVQNVLRKLRVHSKLEAVALLARTDRISA